MEENFEKDNIKQNNLENNLEIKNISNIETEEPDEKPINKKVNIINFIIIGVIFIGLLFYMLIVDGIDNIINLLKSVEYKWVFAGFLCLIAHWICEAIVLHIPIKKIYKNQTFKNSFKVSMIGQLFNNVTPFSTGGQPMQAYEFSKSGKRVSDCFSAMALKFIVTQTALVTFTLIVMCFQFSFFASLMDNFLWIAITSFIVNILAILIVIIAGIKKRAITCITTPIIKILGKIHIIKNVEKTLIKLDESIDNFGNQFKIIKSEKIMILKMFLVAIIQSIAYYSITYMVYRAFGNSGVSFWQIIPAQAFLLLIMTFIPTPGSGLGAEGGFLLIFNSIFKQGTINMSILFWRLYTFYLPIIVGCLFLIPSKKAQRTNRKALTFVLILYFLFVFYVNLFFSKFLKKGFLK